MKIFILNMLTIVLLVASLLPHEAAADKFDPSTLTMFAAQTDPGTVNQLKFATSDKIRFVANFSTCLPKGSLATLNIIRGKKKVESVSWNIDGYYNSLVHFQKGYSEGMYAATLIVKHNGSTTFVDRLNFLIVNCLKNGTVAACEAKVSLKYLHLGASAKNGRIVDPAVEFFGQQPEKIYFSLNFSNTISEQTRLIIIEEKSGKVVKEKLWPSYIHEESDFSFDFQINTLEKMKEGSYRIQISVKTDDDLYYLIHEETFSIQPSKKPSADQSLSINDQLAQIAKLKESLNLKIAEAEKAKSEFRNELRALSEQAAKPEDKVSAKQLDRFKKNIQRKQSFIKLIDEYQEKLTEGFDTLVDIEDDFKDRNRWRMLIESSFVAKVDSAIQRIKALINDVPKKPDKQRKKTKMKGGNT